MMTVKVETLDNFLGVVQSRDYRKPECSGYGENSRITYLRVNMLADDSDPEYCGVFINEVRQNANEFSAYFKGRITVLKSGLQTCSRLNSILLKNGRKIAFRNSLGLLAYY